MCNPHADEPGYRNENLWLNNGMNDGGLLVTPKY